MQAQALYLYRQWLFAIGYILIRGMQLRETEWLVTQSIPRDMGCEVNCNVPWPCNRTYGPVPGLK